MNNEYFVVIDTDLENFIETVNSFLEDGWECQGGIQVIFAPEGRYDQFLYHQAMVL